MRHLLSTAALCVALNAPLSAEEQNPELEEGLGLLDQGVRLMMRGLLEEFDPLVEDAERMGEALLPMLESFQSELSGLMGSIDLYHAPEMLPNGDIIIRRKSEEEVVAEEENAPIDI